MDPLQFTGHQISLYGTDLTIVNSLRACSVIFNPYGLEGIDMDWEGF
jgi:hypothetical protein